MRLTLLGTGNAAGVPVYGCSCTVCMRAQAISDFRRRPCSALIEHGEQRWLIDAGLPDLAERFPTGSLSGILLTHFHPDHVQGLFQLRWGVAPALTVYCPPDPEGCADLYQHTGMLRFAPLAKHDPLKLGTLRVTPLPLIHSRPSLGYLFEDGKSRFAYLTDTAGLPPETTARLMEAPLDLMVIDCTLPVAGAGRANHNDVAQVLQLHDTIRPTTTVLTHIGHEMDAWLDTHADTLPAGVRIGWDNLKLGNTDGVESVDETLTLLPGAAIAAGRATARPRRSSPRPPRSGQGGGAQSGRGGKRLTR